MKVEYSYYAGQPSLTIRGSDFKNALKDTDEAYLLHLSVDAFFGFHDAPLHSSDEVDEAILRHLDEDGTIVYAVRERIVGTRVLGMLSEVYVLNGVRQIEIVVYDSISRKYLLNSEEERA